MVWDNNKAKDIIIKKKDYTGALLPILHDLQDTFGYIDKAAIPEIANELNISEADVYGVISFYHDFTTEKLGNYVIKVCRSESCQAKGNKELIDHIKKRFGIDFGETTADGDFSLISVYCLGNCALSPAIMINKELYGRVNPEKFDEIINNLIKTVVEVSR